ncbi:MAG: type IV secretion protein IcmD [Gammaproteobacteria bacterium]
MMKSLFSLKKVLATASLLGFLAMGTAAYADASDQTIGTVATQVTGSMSAVGKLITAGAFVGGFAFACAAVFKFKAHRENAQQTPLGTPIAFLAIAVFLVFLPTLLGTTGSSLFKSKTAGGFGGEGADELSSTSTTP